MPKRGRSSLSQLVDLLDEHCLRAGNDTINSQSYRLDHWLDDHHIITTVCRPIHGIRMKSATVLERNKKLLVRLYQVKEHE